MKRIIKSIIKKTPIIRRLAAPILMQGAYPLGHYYSPIPTQGDVLAYLKTRRPPSRELPGIDLNENFQLELLNEYIGFYKDIAFPENHVADRRYYYNNGWFGYTDAYFLYCYLRKHKPKKIIEIGSGFSSAVILDTVDAIYPEKPDITFVEPYPDRLNNLLRSGDKGHVNLIDKKIQDVSPDVLSTLGSGDLLFIDSSHVVKCGSDLQLLLFDILPHLRPGVHVHFHDVFYPFDYPAEWLLEGRYWNENYFLRAFLTYNSKWRIQFFNNYAGILFGDLIRNSMPLCARQTGGSLYIQRVQ